jgi:mannose-1-phosphate guanylyltransferase
LTNLILCGGSGTRLWPISRTLMPKQFVKIFNNRSLFQLTVDRNSELCNNRLIVSNTEQYFLALDQLEEMEKSESQYLLEPIGRNTAPAIALACMTLHPDEIVLVTPSDHIIQNLEAYKNAVKEAENMANRGNLVTFGIKPAFPETGFGYIEADGQDVKCFHEKPDILTAEKYLKDGNYYWNSGMFCFQAGAFLDELKKYSPEIYNMSNRAFENAKKGIPIRIQHDDMVSIPEDSIDYAVMEQSKIVKVIKSDIGWNDVGSFDSLYEQLPKDSDGNSINDKHIGIESKNNLIYGQDRVIATIGIEDTIVVDTGDALLITKKGLSQKVKEIVGEIKKTTQLHNIHLTAHRPWGTYTVLEDNRGYKIKKIEVKPKSKLSLQKHFHRNEHWIVVSGTATVTVGENKYLVRPNESTYIKMGEIHRLENEGVIPLTLIEVQVGEYTEEDDIIRILDDFDR